MAFEFFNINLETEIIPRFQTKEYYDEPVSLSNDWRKLTRAFVIPSPADYLRDVILGAARTVLPTNARSHTRWHSASHDSHRLKLWFVQDNRHSLLNARNLRIPQTPRWHWERVLPSTRAVESIEDTDHPRWEVDRSRTSGRVFSRSRRSRDEHTAEREWDLQLRRLHDQRGLDTRSIREREEKLQSQSLAHPREHAQPRRQATWHRWIAAGYR